MSLDSIGLNHRAEEARRAELERAVRQLGRGVPPAEVLEALSRRLSGKLLHAPLKALNQFHKQDNRDETAP